MTATLLMLATLSAAEKSPLLGLSREQLLDREGEPRSQIAAGGREVMYFVRERVVLRGGVVVEVDLLPADPAVRRPRAPAPAPTPVVEPAPPSSATPTSQAANQPSPAPAPVANNAPDASSGQAPAAANDPTGQAVAAPPPPPEPQLSIKSVRPPSAGGSRPAPRPEPAPKAEPVAVAPTAPATPPPSSVTPKTEDVRGSTGKAAPSSPISSLTVASAPPSEPQTTAGAEPAAAGPNASDAPTTAESVPAGASVPDDGQAKKAKTNPQPRGESDFPEPAESIFTLQTYVIAAVIIGAGIGFLIWQSKQRQLELAASAVSRAPFSVEPSAGGGAMFPTDLIPTLEWKRFEELVESYYSKTGVIAVRTKTGPESPVHIKISWKGEPRPFACVQCIAHPSGLIGVEPIQQLFAVLAAEDIRRGYVVTTGKFNVAARDFAEEKHITLLSGDMLLEKLNALPPPVRGELIQEFSVGDYKTPSCPKCEAKLVLSNEDPPVWRCKAHAEVSIAPWK